MSPLATFLEKLEQYGSNNVKALEGQMRFTTNERDDLRRSFDALAVTDQAKALVAAANEELDTTGWGTADQRALAAYLLKLEEYATNNITALEGRIQFTHNEREDLKTWFAKLASSDKPAAVEASTARGLDTAGW
jgi:hypothetical protein